ncbi:insulinase family protein [Sphingomonas sp. So64.6b]|uniref:M16 family metallopeptidase n=1 Tax=Sphingomonas sp. So64.6b TaxID=2997354 RepID=UPI001601937A|nr:pitrilysin family protein [Sphingomonas sp. So64.6b]QNA85638.1 insulinase family protein [Sphingomonas sp. So64.6b]
MSPRILALSGVALIALASPAFAAPAAAPAVQAAKPAPVADLVKQVDIPYEEFTLKNGLRVIVHTDRKAPVVAVSVWYDVGSKHEPKGKTGFAHLFEHLMFNGSENAPGDFFEPLKQVGATDYNGTTWYDRTNYFETVPAPALERALFLESDRMGYLLGAVTQRVLDVQRGVVQNEKRQGDNQPYGLVDYAKTAALFPPEHPYGHDTIGSMADLDAASLKDVKNWFRGHYGPNNSILVIAGDVDVATAKPLVEKYFGAIPAGPKTVRPAAPVPTLPAPKSEVMKDRVATTRIMRTWVVPGLDSSDATALDVAAGVLGGLASSRLDNALVRKEKLAVGVSAGNQTFAQIGTFEVSADVRPGIDPALVAKRLDEIIADFIKNGPTADEVQRVATGEVSDRIEGLESVGGFGGKAVALAQGALYSNDPGFYKKQLATLAAETPANVKAVTAKWLSRPVYALTVEPGARVAYDEAKAPEEVVEAAEPAAFKGTRGEMPAVGTIADLDFPKVERTRLKNGIELIYAQRGAVPITRAVISFDAGVAADPATKLGTQQLVLSMLDEGTTTKDSTAIAEARERLGAEIGTGASLDQTFLSLSTPSANLGPALDLFADVTLNPAFAPAEVARLKNQQLAGIASELTNPGGLAGRALPKLVYGPASPYAKSAGRGDPVAVAALTRDDLVAFQHAWLRPEKAKIFVVSDRPLAEVSAAFDQRFGSWKGIGTAGIKDFGAASAPSAPKILLIDRPDSPQSLILGAAPNGLKGTADLLPVMTANDALGGSFLSRINMDLREDKHWTYGASGNFSRAQNAAPYIVSAPVQADKTGASIAAIRQQVGDFLTTKGLTKAEFDRTIIGKTRELAGSFETSSDVLGAMQTNDLYKRPDDYYATITQKYRAMTQSELDAAARAAIDPKTFIWVVVGDAKTVRPQLDSLGLPVEVVPAASIAGAK